MKKSFATVTLIALLLAVSLSACGSPAPTKQTPPADPRIPYSKGPDSPPHVNQPTTLPPK